MLTVAIFGDIRSDKSFLSWILENCAPIRVIEAPDGLGDITKELAELGQFHAHCICVNEETSTQFELELLRRLDKNINAGRRLIVETGGDSFPDIILTRAAQNAVRFGVPLDRSFALIIDFLLGSALYHAESEKILQALECVSLELPALVLLGAYRHPRTSPLARLPKDLMRMLNEF